MFRHCSLCFFSIGICLFELGHSATAGNFSFTSVGDLSGGRFESTVQAISSDGTVAFGSSESVALNHNEAFRWTASTGIVGLGDLAGGDFHSSVLGVSANGLVAVGMGYTTLGDQAFRWTSSGGMVGLGYLPGTPPGAVRNSMAYDVSGDGNIVVGESSVGAAETLTAFRWTSGTGMVALAAPTGFDVFSEALAISTDGKFIVGNGYVDAGVEAVRWTNGAAIGLGELAGGVFGSSANDVSKDGSVIVGLSFSDNGPEAFRWTSAGGMVGLGALPGGKFFSEAKGVSGDGATIVGRSSTDNGYAAFLWTSDLGMVNLRDYLIAHGVQNLQNWTLQWADGISQDGRVIYGYGLNPDGETEGFVATVPEPSTITLAALGGLLIVTVNRARRR